MSGPQTHNRLEQDVETATGRAWVSRSKVRVRELAALAALSSDEVIRRLQTVGISVVGADDYVPKSKASLARRALGVDPSRPTDSIAHLTAVTSMSEQDLR